MLLDEKDGPWIMTCVLHDNGSNLEYFHPPKHPSKFPCEVGDQFAQCVVAPQIAKSAQAHKYSRNYQVVRIDGGFKGIGCCDVREIGKFDYTTDILDKQMAISLYG